MITKKQLETATKELLDNRDKMVVLVGMSKITQALIKIGHFHKKLCTLCTDGTWSAPDNSGLFAIQAYCLPPVPVVPKILEGWLDLPVDSLGYVSVAKSTYANYADLGRILRELRPVVTGFGGYVYGSHPTNIFNTLQGYDGNNLLSRYANDWVKPAIPSHVRVWSTDLVATKALLKIA